MISPECLADQGAARGYSAITVVTDGLTSHPFPPLGLKAPPHPSGLEIPLPNIKSTQKLHHLFKSYGNFDEGVGFFLLVQLLWEGSAPAACIQMLT